jgi:hypothetical protein
MGFGIFASFEPPRVIQLKNAFRAVRRCDCPAHAGEAFGRGVIPVSRMAGWLPHALTQAASCLPASTFV